jgi:hypothetical protein
VTGGLQHETIRALREDGEGGVSSTHRGQGGHLAHRLQAPIHLQRSDTCPTWDGEGGLSSTPKHLQLSDTCHTWDGEGGVSSTHRGHLDTCSNMIRALRGVGKGG